MGFVQDCEFGNIDVIDSYLQNEDFDVNQPEFCCFSNRRTTGLIQACGSMFCYKVDVINRLLSRGADVDLQFGHVCAIGVLLSQEPFDAGLTDLVMRGSRLGINKVNYQGQSYLWYCRTLEACRYLVESGIDVNLISYNDLFLSNGQTASDYLSKFSFDKPEICNYLSSVKGKCYSQLEDH